MGFKKIITSLLPKLEPKFRMPEAKKCVICYEWTIVNYIYGIKCRSPFSSRGLIALYDDNCHISTGACKSCSERDLVIPLEELYDNWQGWYTWVNS